MDELQLVLELLVEDKSERWNTQTTITLGVLYEIVKNANKIRGEQDNEIRNFNRG